MLSNMKVGTKLLAVAAAPLLLALLLTFVGIQDRRADAASAADTEQLVAFSNRTTALVDSLQSERTGTTDRLAGSTNIQLDALREETDADADAFDAGRNGLPADDELAAAIEEAVTALDGVEDVDRVDGSSADDSIVAEYTQVINRLFEVQREVAEQPALGNATNDVLSLLQIGEAKEVGAAIEAQTALAFGDGSADVTVAPAVAAELAALESARAEAADRLSQLPSDEATDLTAQAFSEWSQSDELENLMTIFVATTTAGTVGDADRTRLDAAIEGYTDALREAELSVAESTQERATDAANTASTNARNFMIIWLIAAIISVVLAVVLAKALTRRLVRLTAAADDLAEHQLPNLVEQLRTPPDETTDEEIGRPEPVDVHGSDEIGQLADSFNTVQTVAYDVAIEQGKMLEQGISEIFVNLARRNQALIDRQIQFIDELERHEEDPDVLESLFRLDHLATRMRRHAESLLVLAGAEPSRRRSAPVSLSDVVRVAVGEIEDYNRISLVAIDDAEVPSGAAVDVAHMLSELMENATQFSPPDTVVEIVGHRTHEGYTVSISDQGIGMSAEQLDDVNELLASPPATGLTLNRTLGFVVIARLARRFAVNIRLTSSPSGGVTALVTLPEAVLVGTEVEDQSPSEEGSAPILIADAAPPIATTSVVTEVDVDGTPGLIGPEAGDVPGEADPDTIVLEELPSRGDATAPPAEPDQEVPAAAIADQFAPPEPVEPELPAADLELPPPFPVTDSSPTTDVEEPDPFHAPEPAAIDEPDPFQAPEPAAIDEPDPFQAPEPVPYTPPQSAPDGPPEPFEPLAPIASRRPEPEVEPEPEPLEPFAPAADAEPEPLEPRLPPPPAEPLAPFTPAQDDTPLPIFSAPAAPAPPTGEAATEDWGSGRPLTPTESVADAFQQSDGFTGLPSRVGSSSLGEPTGPPPPLDPPAAGSAPADSGQTTPGGLPLWQPTFVPAPPAAGADDLTSAGLTRRERPVGESSALPTGPTVTSTRRSPEEVRQMLSRYRGGLKKGRTAPADAGTTTHESSPSS